MKQARRIILIFSCVCALLLGGCTNYVPFEVSGLPDGTEFVLTDWYGVDWDEVVIINTPMDKSEVAKEKLYAIFDAVDNFGQVAQVGDIETAAILAFYRNAKLCDVKMYNYALEDAAIFCKEIPDANCLPQDFFTIPRGKDHFIVQHFDNRVYVVWKSE